MLHMSAGAVQANSILNKPNAYTHYSFSLVFLQYPMNSYPEVSICIMCHRPTLVSHGFNFTCVALYANIVETPVPV
jgi:hypothetical protein